VDGGGEFRIALTQVVLGLGVHEDLLPHALWVRRLGNAGLGTGPLPLLTDEDGQHLAVAYPGIL